MGQDLTIIVVQILLFIGSYGINMNVIHLFVLFRHIYCMSICVVNTQKSCAQLSCLNNA